ncbi:hypothetical protein N7452_005802 [Penicillium brevicompactum]|uniref:Uncharacterized protein n=1 Tax=Penicillium brevicompactum TaxID=5074 RepID=A0A9W9QM86_PENBR|nr:hypothetical protein N7452_005802 [Penicillium brevicompactum]
MDPPPNLPDRVKEVFRQQPQFLRFSKAYRAYVALYCAGELKLPQYVEENGEVNVWPGELWCRRKGCLNGDVSKPAGTRNLRKHLKKHGLNVRMEKAGQLSIAERDKIIRIYKSWTGLE